MVVSWYLLNFGSRRACFSGPQIYKALEYLWVWGSGVGAVVVSEPTPPGYQEMIVLVSESNTKWQIKH